MGVGACGGLLYLFEGDEGQGFGCFSAGDISRGSFVGFEEGVGLGGCLVSGAFGGFGAGFDFLDLVEELAELE